MTTEEITKQHEQTIQRVQSVLRTHRDLRDYAQQVDINLEDSAIVLSGYLPNESLVAALIPAVRQAGVLDQVVNEVRVP